MNNTTKKCKGCEERHTGCHSTCPHYSEFLETNEKKKAAIRKEHETNNMLYDYARNKKQKLVRRRHKKQQYETK